MGRDSPAFLQAFSCTFPIGMTAEVRGQENQHPHSGKMHLKLTAKA